MTSFCHGYAHSETVPLRLLHGQPEIAGMSSGNAVNNDGVTHAAHTCIYMYVILVLILIFTVAPMDYGAPSLILMFGSCETRSCVNVDIVDDLVDEPVELFRVTLNRTNGLDSRISLNPVDGQIEIIDNDGNYTALINSLTNNCVATCTYTLQN